MNYVLGSWSGLLIGEYTQEKVDNILHDAAEMWGKETKELQPDGSYIFTHEGVKNRIYFADGKIWRTDEVE